MISCRNYKAFYVYFESSRLMNVHFSRNLSLLPLEFSTLTIQNSNRSAPPFFFLNKKHLPAPTPHYLMIRLGFIQFFHISKVPLPACTVSLSNTERIHQIPGFVSIILSIFIFPLTFWIALPQFLYDQAHHSSFKDVQGSYLIGLRPLHLALLSRRHPRLLPGKTNRICK